MIKKYTPSLEEYLKFEEECNLSKEIKALNRKKYGFSEEEINKFYNIQSVENVIKKSKNKRDVRREYNISRADTDLMCKIFNKVFDTNRECFVRLRCAETNVIYAYNVQDLKDSNKLFNILH